MDSNFDIPVDDTPAGPWMSLAGYRKGAYHPGKSVAVRVLWYLVSATVFESTWFPVYGIKRWLLRRFGAVIGDHVVIKPRVRIKYPWHLSIGDDSWIGEETWIDNLVDVRIGRDACLSQGVYVCTGSHDSRQLTFDLIVEPIDIGDEVWIAARTTLLPGVEIARGVVILAGSVVTKSALIPAGMRAGGVPARVIGPRVADFEEAERAPTRPLSAVPR